MLFQNSTKEDLGLTWNFGVYLGQIKKNKEQK